jgi:hypothetical protein
MAIRSWIRRLFDRKTRTIRKDTVRFRPRLEALEDRTVPSGPPLIVNNPADLAIDLNSSNIIGGATTITLAQGFTFDFTSPNGSTNGTDALPAITADITILGNGDTIERTGTNAFRLFDVASGGSLDLENVTLTGGLAKGTGAAAKGGAVYSSGTLTLNDVTVKGNTAQGSKGATIAGQPGGAGSNAAGGGLYIAAGSVTLTNDTLSANKALGGKAGLGAQGGNGGSGDGGAVYVAGGNVTLENDTLGENIAQGGTGGSGLEVGTAGYSGVGSGGGLYVAAGNVTLLNDTLSRNGAVGGGVNVPAGPDVPTALGTLSISTPGNPTQNNQVILVNNSITGPFVPPTVGSGSGGGLHLVNGSTVSLTNTLIADNVVAGAAVAGSAPSDPDLSGNLASSDHDLIGQGSGSNLSNGVNGNQVGTPSTPLNPVLSPLQNNGGPTATMALLPGSPAIDAGNSSASNLPRNDQRGYNRIAGAAVDIGAYEAQGFTLSVTGGNNQTAQLTGTYADPLVVTVTALDGVDAVAGGQITFTPPSSGASAVLSPNNPVTIAADGTATVNATPNSVVGNYTVTVNTAGAVNTAAISLTNTPSSAMKLIDQITEKILDGGGTITLPANTIYDFTAPYNSSPLGANAMPEINCNITIIGSGGDIIERSTAAGVPAFRLFQVDGGGR